MSPVSFVAFAFSGAFSAGGALASAFAGGAAGAFAGGAGAAGLAGISSCTAHEERANTIAIKTAVVIDKILFILPPSIMKIFPGVYPYLS
jgi:hypothetical protein